MNMEINRIISGETRATGAGKGVTARNRQVTWAGVGRKASLRWSPWS